MVQGENKLEFRGLCAKDASVGIDGSFWIIGCNEGQGGYEVLRFNSGLRKFEVVEGGYGVQVSALTEHSAVIVTNNDEAFTVGL